MSKTEENLKKAFAIKSQTNQKNRVFAKKARMEGFPNIARLFKLTSEAERIHAEGNFIAMNLIGSTKENVKTALSRGLKEYKEVYPLMLEEAVSENHKAKRMFGYVVKSEEVHAHLYDEALKALEDGKDLEVSDFYLCPSCGNIKSEKPAEDCPICKGPAEKFVKIN